MALWLLESAVFNPNYPSSHAINLLIFLSVFPSLHLSGGSVYKWSFALGNFCSGRWNVPSGLWLLSASPSQVSLVREEISGASTQKETEASGGSISKQHILTFHNLLGCIAASLFVWNFRKRYDLINSGIIEGNKRKFQNEAEHFVIVFSARATFAHDSQGNLFLKLKYLLHFLWTWSRRQERYGWYVTIAASLLKRMFWYMNDSRQYFSNCESTFCW